MTPMDYMRISLANFNILIPQIQSGACHQFEFMNIRGHECFNCTAPLWYGKLKISYTQTVTKTSVNSTKRLVQFTAKTTLAVMTLLIHYTDVRLDLTPLLNFGWMTSETMPSLLFSAALDDRA